MLRIRVGVELGLLFRGSYSIGEGVYLFGMDTPIVVLGKMSHERIPGFIEHAPANAIEQHNSFDELASPAGYLKHRAGA